MSYKVSSPSIAVRIDPDPDALLPIQMNTIPINATFAASETGPKIRAVRGRRTGDELSDGCPGSYEPVIGLEVHVQLKTRTKIFCRCANLYGAEPNSLVCPVCLGYPGALPVLNRRAVDLAIRLALALGATVHSTSAFARKNYFYPDLPKGYQITQGDRPLATGGELILSESDRRIPIRRLHLEEDAGKLLHEDSGDDGFSLVDFNRAGVPLVEIVTEPNLTSPAETQYFLQSLRQVLLYTEVSDAVMEQGSLRCDANISVRRRGEARLGARTEVKNLNSFRHVARAVDHEIDRQIAVLESGAQVIQESRTFHVENATTSPLRRKEASEDYRFFPEPDLPPLQISRQRLGEQRRQLPELPAAARRRLAARYALGDQETRVLTTSRALTAYYEQAVAAYPEQPRRLANWIKTEMLRELKERRIEIEQAIEPSRLAGLVALVDAGELSTSGAKRVFAELWNDGRPARELARSLGLIQVRDRDQLAAWTSEILEAHRAEADEYRTGKTGLLGFLIGRVMHLSGGRADPELVRDLLAEALGPARDTTSEGEP